MLNPLPRQWLAKVSASIHTDKHTAVMVISLASDSTNQLEGII